MARLFALVFSTIMHCQNIASYVLMADTGFNKVAYPRYQHGRCILEGARREALNPITTVPESSNTISLSLMGSTPKRPSIVLSRFSFRSAFTHICHTIHYGICHHLLFVPNTVSLTRVIHPISDRCSLSMPS